MQSYLVKLLFNININEGEDRKQFDEQVRIVKSCSPEEAFLKARSIGRDEEEIFLNAESKLVNWQFIDVIELISLDQANDGDYLYSHSRNEDDHGSYIQYIKQKAMELQSKNLTFV